MSEIPSEKQRDLYEVLSYSNRRPETGWHPVLSSVNLDGSRLANFWVGEHFEWLGEDGPIHESAEAFRVDFMPETIDRDGANISAVGKTALISMPHRLRLKTVGERTYVRVEQVLPEKAESAYLALLTHASHVAGMPFETPLRWQSVHGMSLLGEIGGEVSRYVMGDFGDGRKIMIDHEYGQESEMVGPWRLESTIPLADGSGNFLKTKILRTNTKPDVRLYTTSPGGNCIDYKRGTAEDIIGFMNLMNEAMNVLPQKQEDFLALLNPQTS